MNYKLNIESQIWNKDTNSLFDYESINYFLNNIKVYEKGKIYLCDKALRFLKEKDQILPEYSYMCTIKVTSDNYFVFFDNLEQLNSKQGPILSLQDRIWLILRHTYFQNNSYKIKEGDVIKLGKIIFKVKEIFIKSSSTQCDKLGLTQNNKDLIIENDGDVFSQNQGEILNINNNMYTVTNTVTNTNTNLISKNNVHTDITKEIHVEKKRKKLNVPICRICLGDENYNNNPLINPCTCSGTMKYIHLYCLKQWLNSRLQTKTINYLTIYSFKNIQCEICKMQMPEKIKIKNDIFNLIEYTKPESSYLVWESYGRDKSEPFYLYVIDMKDKVELTLGRSNESDIRMPDISVSRNHAIIRLSNNGFYMEDALSKFGTLVQINSELMLLPNKTLALQIGKSFLAFLVEKTCLGILRCYRYPNNKIFDYNDYFNEKWKYIKEFIHKCDEINDSQIYSESESEKKADKIQNVKTIDYIECSNTEKGKLNEEEKRNDDQVLFSIPNNKSLNELSLKNKFKNTNNGYEMILMNTENEVKKGEENPGVIFRRNSSNNILVDTIDFNRGNKKSSFPKPLNLLNRFNTNLKSIDNLPESRVLEELKTIPVSGRKSKDSFRSSDMVINSVFKENISPTIKTEIKIRKHNTNNESNNEIHERKDSCFLRNSLDKLNVKPKSFFDLPLNECNLKKSSN